MTKKYSDSEKKDKKAALKEITENPKKFIKRKKKKTYFKSHRKKPTHQIQ